MPQYTDWLLDSANTYVCNSLNILHVWRRRLDLLSRGSLMILEMICLSSLRHRPLVKSNTPSRAFNVMDSSQLAGSRHCSMMPDKTSSVALPAFQWAAACVSLGHRLVVHCFLLCCTFADSHAQSLIALYTGTFVKTPAWSEQRCQYLSSILIT